MEKPTSTSILLPCSLLVLLVFCCRIPSTRSQEVEDEKEFSYEVGRENGPERWGDLNPAWALCKNGTMQSPIDLTSERVEVVPGLGRLKRSYKPAHAKLRNRGHDIMLRWVGDAGSIHIDGVEYHLKQCHWHSPSEHSINGRRFEMEVHLVHQSSENTTAVLGIMYKRGRPDTFLSEVPLISSPNHHISSSKSMSRVDERSTYVIDGSKNGFFQLMEPIQDIANTRDSEREVGVVDPRHIKLGSRKYYRYLGSLTTPPCLQSVVWTITRKVRTVSLEQMRLLREGVHDGAEKNARPLQPINERAIHFYRPEAQGERPRH